MNPIPPCFSLFQWVRLVGNRLRVAFRGSAIQLSFFLLLLSGMVAIDSHLVSRHSNAAPLIQATQPPAGPPQVLPTEIFGQDSGPRQGLGFQLYFPIIEFPSQRTSDINLIPGMPTRQSGEPIVGTPTQTPAAGATATATPSASPISATSTALSPTLSPTHSATVHPDGTSTPTVTPTATSQTGSAEIPPTPDPIVAQCQETLVDASMAAQIGAIEEDLSCTRPFVDLMLAEPALYLDTFYGLITSTVATDELWTVTYDMAIRGEFRTTASGVENLWDNFDRVIGQCEGAYRCPDWETYVLPLLWIGEMYGCPDLDGFSQSASTEQWVNQLLASVPYGDYFCTEETASAIATAINSDESALGDQAIAQLNNMSATLEQGWSRRNALRVLGRLAEQPSNSVARTSMMTSMEASVLAGLLVRLNDETYVHALHDVIWVVDSFYFPSFEAQPALEQLSQSTDYDSALRFRAMGAISRLIDRKGALSENDLAFLAASLSSDDGWVRAQAAFTLQLLEDALPTTDDEGNSGEEGGEDGTESQRDAVVSLLQNAYATEAEFMTKASIAQALDSYNGTDLRAELQAEYEADYLPNELSFNHIKIRSGLAQETLPGFMQAMRQTEDSFFEVLGPPFDSPVPNDPTEAMTLLLFASRDEYRDYMNAFVGYGAEAGGLYLESWATLYTWHREPSESNYTVEHLIQHEFTHYLQGRYVFPGLWGEAGYHTEPKGWMDEGTAEVFGGLSVQGLGLIGGGSATFPVTSVHLNTLCGGSYTPLATLLNRRAGYDQPGTFDYANGWAFMTYLMTQRKDAALSLYQAMRDETYRVANFDAIVAMPLSEMEFGWHQAMNGWCSDDGLVHAASLQRASLTTEVVTVAAISELAAVASPQPPATHPTQTDDQIIRLVRR